MLDPPILCDGVSRRYGAHLALAPLDLRVEAAEVFGLVGGNGGAKTTLLRLLAGVLAPSAGTLKIFGKPADQQRERVGYMPQGLALQGELTVAENLRGQAALYGVPAPREAAAAMLARYGLTALAKRRAGQLSGGQARLAQLAAALIHGPAVVLLDEPTVGLDPAVRLEVWEHIGALAAAGTTVVVSTHDLGEAACFSRLAFMSEGRLLALGPPDAIVATARNRHTGPAAARPVTLEDAVRTLLRPAGERV